MCVVSLPWCYVDVWCLIALVLCGCVVSHCPGAVWMCVVSLPWCYVDVWCLIALVLCGCVLSHCPGAVWMCGVSLPWCCVDVWCLIALVLCGCVVSHCCVDVWCLIALVLCGCVVSHCPGAVWMCGVSLPWCYVDVWCLIALVLCGCVLSHCPGAVCFMFHCLEGADPSKTSMTPPASRGVAWTTPRTGKVSKGVYPASVWLCVTFNVFMSMHVPITTFIFSKNMHVNAIFFFSIQSTFVSGQAAKLHVCDLL